MPDIILDLAAAVFIAILSHEGGHYVAALCFGHKIKFGFEWGKLFNVVPVPRGVWNMPDFGAWPTGSGRVLAPLSALGRPARRKQRIVALAGFGTEFLCAGAAMAVLRWPYLLLVASIHLIAYPFYAGESSDFKWL